MFVLRQKGGEGVAGCPQLNYEYEPARLLNGQLRMIAVPNAYDNISQGKMEKREKGFIYHVKSQVQPLAWFRQLATA